MGMHTSVHKMTQRQESLPKFLKLLGQSVPKHAKTASAYQQSGDSGGHSCTGSGANAMGRCLVLQHLLTF